MKMRLHFVLLWLAVVTFVLGAEASARVGAEQSAPHVADQLSLGAGKRVEYAKRALRTDDATGEERARIPGLSKLAGLVSKDGPSAENLANNLWLRGRTDPAKVLKTLEVGAKLDDNPKVLQWLKYVQMYRTTKNGYRWHDGEIYVKLLQSSKSEAEVAKLFQSLKTNPELAKLGENLQKAQFGSWIIKDMHPSSIPSMLGLTGGIPLNNPRTEIVKKYALEYAIHTGMRPAGDKTKLTLDELTAILKIG